MITVKDRTKAELILLAQHHAECLDVVLTAMAKCYLVDHDGYEAARGHSEDVRYYLKRMEESET